MIRDVNFCLIRIAQQKYKDDVIYVCVSLDPSFSPCILILYVKSVAMMSINILSIATTAKSLIEFKSNRKAKRCCGGTCKILLTSMFWCKIKL